MNPNVEPGRTAHLADAKAHVVMASSAPPKDALGITRVRIEFSFAEASASRNALRFHNGRTVCLRLGHGHSRTEAPLYKLMQ
jgi:hypothetical protein